MTTDTIALTTLCEFTACVLLIIGYIHQDKLRRFERGILRVVAVYFAVFKMWREERHNGRINAR